ncbi:MAG: FliM/FliN family flagellar motor C-terminal domain-containing protein [Armatimonadota bacterium]
MSPNNVTRLKHPPVDAPGLFDQKLLADLTRRCVVECRSGISSRLSGGLRGMSCSCAIVDDSQAWKSPTETVDFAIPLDAGTGVLRIPAGLARQIVASSLGYEEATDEGLNSADNEILAAALQPLVLWLQQLLEPRGALALHRCDEPAWEPAGRAVMLRLTLDVQEKRDTMKLAVPWPIIRQPLRAQGELRRSATISVEALSQVCFRADAVIDGGTIQLQEGFRLQPGDVVAVDEQPESDLKLLMGDSVVAKGKLGSQQNSWAIRITDVAGLSDIHGRGERDDE